MPTTNLTQQLQVSGYYATGGHFRFVSGKHSESYVQARLSLMDPLLREAFVGLASAQLNDSRVSAFAAFTVGGLLLAQALAARYSVPLIVGRKVAAGVEWFAPPSVSVGENVVLIDDALTTTSQIDPALRSLEGLPSVECLAAVLIAVRTGSGAPPEVSFRGESITVRECLHVPLSVSDPSVCQLCRYGVPLKDLSNPDRDFISVVLSQPPERAEWILSGYKAVYELQKESTLISEIRAWTPWLPVLLAGLPVARMEEDSRLIRFVTHITEAARSVNVSTRVLSDIVGQLVRWRLYASRLDRSAALFS
jgi:orotate phosphoribosyltransferase